MAHSWSTNFLPSMLLLFFSGSVTIFFILSPQCCLACFALLFHLISEASLKILVVFFSTYQSSFHFPFSTSVYLHMSPGSFMKRSQVSFRKAVGTASLREEEWRPWYIRLGARGVSALLGHQFSHLSYTTPPPTVPCSCLWTAGTCSILPFTVTCLWDEFPVDAPHGWSWGPLWTLVSASLHQWWLWRHTRYHSSATRAMKGQTDVQPTNKNRHYQEQKHIFIYGVSNLSR